MSASSIFFAIVGRDIGLAIRGGIGSLVAVVFFVIAVALFPLGVGPELNLLNRIAPGVLWVCALLATMLSLDSLFREDFEDGNLEQIALGVLPLEAVVLAKALAHWITTGLPLIIHSRDADDDMARILTEEHAKGAFTCVMHCFTSSPALAETALGLGFYLSMSGITAFPRSSDLRDIFAAAPVDRILVETDAPYLAPPPYRGKRNEPAYTVHTAKVGAELFGMDYAAFAAQIEANFERLFTKVATYEAAA